MKSQLFSKNAWLGAEKFKKDLKKISEIDSDVLTELPKIVLDVHLSETDDDAQVIYTESAKKLGIDEYVLKSNFQIIGSFIKEFAPDGDAYADSVESIVKDIKDAEILDDENIKKIEKLLAVAKKIGSEKFYSADKRKSYQKSGLPILEGISGTANLRAVFNESFKSTDSIEDYTPECEGLVPVATVKLRLENSSFDNVFFQMSPSQIRLVINNLLALEKQMEEAINFTKTDA